MNNPFSMYEIRMPSAYKDKIDKFTKTSGRKNGPLLSPFSRQVDLWFTAFLYAVSSELEPVEETDTYAVVKASILSQDSHRVPTIQIVALGYEKDPTILADSKRVFDLASKLVYAGLPYVINILDDPDEDKPLWALLSLYEEHSKGKS